MKREKIIENLQLKLLTIRDLEEFNKLLKYAFQVSKNDLFKSGWNSEEIKQSKTPILEKAKVLGFFDNNNLVSQIALYPMRMNIYGKIYSMCGITGVATYPEYSNLGLMKRLMQEALNHMRKNQQSISCLYPYSIPYYRSRGWEIASDKMTFKLKDTQLPKTIPTHGRIRRVAQTHPDLLVLHNLFARQTHGCLIRDQLAWDEYWRWDSEDESVAIYYDLHNRARGYIVYLIENDVFWLKEMVYLDTEAHMGLWEYIKAHRSMFDELRGSNYTNESLSFLLEDGDIQEMITPYIMARIVDVSMFFEKYPFDRTNYQGKILFHVRDPLLEWNHKSFVFDCKKLSISDDLSCVEKEVSLDIQTLTTMLLGYKRPMYLKNIGRLETDLEVIEILEELLPEGKAYFSDYF